MSESIRKILSATNDYGDSVPKRNTNALFFPWSPIDDVDIIAGEKFANSKDINLPDKKHLKSSE
ncbi:MAG TPA: hypothetical protein GXZ78_08185 [Eubacteriaceae bacterium]|nr:hypothetical protein [Eubacteriaceae bacterium]